jgi:hypothetical protein
MTKEELTKDRKEVLMIKGKTLSLIAKTVAIVYALVASLIFKIPATEIVILSAFIAEAFITVDISLIKTAVK